MQDHAGHGIGHLDLTGKARGDGLFWRHIEHLQLIGASATGCPNPFSIHDDVASAASAGAAAVGIDAGHAIVHGYLHERLTCLKFYFMLCSIMLNKRNATHEFISDNNDCTWRDAAAAENPRVHLEISD